MRLDKFLADTTELTRSLAGKAIRQKRVFVNGEQASSGAQQISEQDHISLDGETLKLQTGFRYLLLNKPQGYVCANSDSLHPLVFDLLKNKNNKKELHTVGRLDIDTTGLLLITDDGQFSHKLTSPKHKVEKTYRATLAEPLRADAEILLAQGILLDDEDKPTLPAQLIRLSATEVKIIICEGRYHQVKRMFAALGNAVIKLHREQFGALNLNDLNLIEGQYRELTPAELALLMRS